MGMVLQEESYSCGIIYLHHLVPPGLCKMWALRMHVVSYPRMSGNRFKL